MAGKTGREDFTMSGDVAQRKTSRDGSANGGAGWMAKVVAEFHKYKLCGHNLSAPVKRYLGVTLVTSAVVDAHFRDACTYGLHIWEIEQDAEPFADSAQEALVIQRSPLKCLQIFICLTKLRNTHICRVNKPPQSSPCNLPVRWNGQGRNVPLFCHDNMAALLTGEMPSHTFKCSDHIFIVQHRQCGHQTATSTCRVSTVNGSPCSARTSRHA